MSNKVSGDRPNIEKLNIEARGELKSTKNVRSNLDNNISNVQKNVQMKTESTRTEDKRSFSVKKLTSLFEHKIEKKDQSESKLNVFPKGKLDTKSNTKINEKITKEVPNQNKINNIQIPAQKQLKEIPNTQERVLNTKVSNISKENGILKASSPAPPPVPERPSWLTLDTVKAPPLPPRFIGPRKARPGEEEAPALPPRTSKESPITLSFSKPNLPKEEIESHAKLKTLNDVRQTVGFQSKSYNGKEATNILKKELNATNKSFKMAKKSPAAMDQLTDFYTLIKSIGDNPKDPSLKAFVNSKSVKNFLLKMEKEYPAVKPQHANIDAMNFARERVMYDGRAKEAEKKKMMLSSEDKELLEKIQSSNVSQSEAEKLSPEGKAWLALSNQREKSLSNARAQLEASASKFQFGNLPEGKLKQQRIAEKQTMDLFISGKADDELKLADQFVDDTKPLANYTQSIESSYVNAFGADKILENKIDTTMLSKALNHLQRVDEKNAEVYKQLNKYAQDLADIINTANSKLEKGELTYEEKGQLAKRLEACHDEYKEFRIPSDIPIAKECAKLRGYLNELGQKRIPAALGLI